MRNQTTNCGAGNWSAIVRTLVVCAVLLPVGGCGPNSRPATHLTGTVTIKGEPIPSDAQAAMSFKPAKGSEAISVPIVDSRYDSPSIPVGTVNVSFYISKPDGPVKVSERTGEKYRDRVNLVPPEHAAGMVIEVNGDDTTHDFEL